MKTIHTAAGMILGGLLMLTLGAQEANTTRENPEIVLGTFDSRAVAVAYIRSDAFSKYMAAQQADVKQAIERAKAAGDLALVAQLNALGPAMQERIHQQGFSAAPVDDIIARIEDELPAIAKEAGVDVIVSKWTLTYRSSTARSVDVTDLLAAEFEPNEQTWKIIHELVRSEPVPADQISDH